LFYGGEGVSAFVHVFPWVFSAILAAQCEVIDFSFYLTKPAYCWAATLFLINGYAVPGIFILSSTESKRALREAHRAVIDVANLLPA
jgi:hypothetical protein